MNEQVLYLKQNVQVEPLIDQWYAWSHLIPPATAARNITQRHMKIMESFISAPQVHANAVTNPKMLGGPFIDYAPFRVKEIEALRNRICRDRAHLIEFSDAIADLEMLLRTAAKGGSLHALYPKVPESLRGYVELVYDINNNASYRLCEALLYRSAYYDTSMQSIMLSTLNGDDRPFVLSTPRLEAENTTHLKVPFSHEVVDSIFELKSNGRSLSQVRHIFDGLVRFDDILANFFSSVPPPTYDKYSGDGIRWRYFGHACILVETKTASILMDPVLSYTYESDISRYTYTDIPEVLDFVIITHNHQDHILFETLLQLRHKIRTIIVPRSGAGALQDPSLKLMLEAVGFMNVIEMSEMEKLTVAGLTITAMPFFGEHADLDIRSKAIYHINDGSRSLVFAADACNVEPLLYDHLHAEIGDVDVLFLGMECDGAPLTWLYGPLLTQPISRSMDQSRRLSGSNYEQALDIVTRLRCHEVYVYAMGQEPWLNYIMSLKYGPESAPIIESEKLLRVCRERGIKAERLFGEKEIVMTRG